MPAPIMIDAGMLAPHDRRVDFERGMSYAPPVSLVLIAINIVVFIWELATGALASKNAIIAAGALSRDEVMQGEVWRIVTCMFLHGGIDHLIGNCIALYALGMACEHAFGSARTLAIYFISGLSGSLMSLALTQGHAVGASGAIFGLSAAVVVFLYRYHQQFYLRDKRIAFVLLVWAVYTVGTGFLQPEIDNFCHIGGFVGGAIAGAILPQRSRAEMNEAFAVIVKKAE
jgi:rhomboid protease GluP